MAIDAKKVIQKLKGESERGRITLYLDKKLIKEFQAVCKKIGVSSNRVLEELARQFIEADEYKEKSEAEHGWPAKRLKAKKKT